MIRGTNGRCRTTRAMLHEILHDETLSAAEILGVGERVGSLEVGKDATLIVIDGEPWEVTSRVEAAFIGGREIDLSNKQSKLADKYREKYRQLGVTRED